eukprot:CAMPEP_0203811294 /NCGR_PEP_ID=MMETSP0115-20131106/3475_1 /ASSEMBLY_ACC=CAM_ASM_000227 /TAXON_ID=33651 /ORGANISM="Bicosoecid sp, Strain ms1" /LENGTH=622 /DNA_ID=CAMNT_0050720115 /DNA_START=29 /DNA_END=1897 /DNA_ORIENTATION=-
MAAPTPMAFVIAGKIDDKEFHQARVVARHLASENAHVTVEVQEFTESDWEEYIRRKAKELGGDAYAHRLSPLVYYNRVNYIGLGSDFLAFVARVFNYVTRPNNVLYTRMAHRAYRDFLDGSANPFAYFDVSVGGGKAERVVFELFADKCPRTVENFLSLCAGTKGRGHSYVGTPFHRVVPGGWVQGGDTAGGHGDGGEAAAGGTIADESFEIKHDRPGILAMANDGGPHSNGSQFYITLAELPWLDYKRVAFGRVISGMRVVRRLEKETCENQRPVAPCVIQAAGEYTSATYKTSPASAAGGSGGAAEEKKESPAGDRAALYTETFNEVDTEGRGRVAGRALAKRVKRSARKYVPHFTAKGTAVLVKLMRAEDSITFEAFTARADEVAAAANSRGGIEAFMRLNGVPDSPFGSDARTEAEQKRCLDLRRPATKKKLLRRVFDDTDSSGDNLVSRSELLAALSKPDSLLVKHFPKHVKEIPKWIEACGGASMTWAEFSAVASRALAKPGGRAGDVGQKVADPLGKDDRPIAEKAKHMDLRRPKTKKRLLQQVFKEVDTSKDGFVDRAELMAALKGDDSPLKRHFPKHLHDVPRWLEGCTKDQKLTYEQFERVAWGAINAPSRA